MTTTVYAGRFDFEDGGTYCGGWEDGKAHGHGVCTGPKSMGEFSGMWQFGYEVSGVYIWPSGNCYQGQWMSGKRHGLGVEKKQRWIYKGEWSQGFKGRYGVRISEASGAKYEGTWANGLQDGYGSETYADAGTYFGQMSQGMRNGYGIRKSVSYGVASRYRSKDVKDSLTSLRSEDGDEKTQRERDRRFDENRGGFVLRAKSDISEDLNAVANATSNVYMPNSGNIMTNTLNSLLRRRRNSLNQSQDRRVSLRKTIISKLKKQKSVGDIDEVNTVGGGAHTSNLHTTSSSGRTNKKSSFRSTSSNNSVDSRTSNRTAPPGLGLNNTLGSHHMTGGGNHAGNQQDDGEHSFISQDEITDVNCIEVYMGEWKQDKRTGFGIAERSDGLKYEGEWFNNKKNGYGVTTFKDGTKEEGKYRNNVLATDKKKTAKLLTLRSNKIRQKIDAAVNAALKAGQIAQQRADIALARAVNARTKANAAEMAAKQSKADSEFARMRAREVAPDFIQPGELKRIPEIVLDIDRMNGFGPPQLQSSIGDPVAFNNISPDQFRKLQQPLNVQMNDTYGMGWQPQQQQQQSNYTPHSSTPPPPGPMMRHQTPTRNQFNALSNPSTASYYDPTLQQQQQQQNLLLHQHSMDFPNSTNNNYLSSNQLMMQHQHPSIDSSSTGPLQQQLPPKLNNDNMSGLNQLDAQTMAQMQMNPNFMQQQAAFNNKQHLLQQQQNYSFDEQLASNYYDPSMNYRMSLLQQAQSHSFNMDMLSSTGAGGPNGLSPMEMQQYSFQRNNPKRSTLRRTQRVIDSSTDDLNNNMIGDFNSLSPQQQQQLLMMRNQHYSNNSSGQESGIGTGSSVYTNMTSNVHGANIDMNSPNAVQQALQQQQQQQQQQPHHPHHHHGHHPANVPGGGHPSSAHHPNGRPQLISGKSMDASAGQRILDPDFMRIPIQLPRRKSLPSIVKMKSYKEDETAHSSSELNEKNQETFIIENGIRKRVTEKSNSAMTQNKLAGANEDASKNPQANAQPGGLQGMNENMMNMMDGVDDGGNNLRHRRPYEYDDDEMPQLPRKIVIESITTLNSPDSAITGSKRVSMPSIPAYFTPKLASKVMSREEANRLSSMRREEIRKNRELESNKMLRLKNILKDVFLRNRLFLFIILFNISLAIWFLQTLK